MIKRFTLIGTFTRVLVAVAVPRHAGIFAAERTLRGKRSNLRRHRADRGGHRYGYEKDAPPCVSPRECWERG